MYTRALVRNRCREKRGRWLSQLSWRRTRLCQTKKTTEGKRGCPEGSNQATSFLAWTNGRSTKNKMKCKVRLTKAAPRRVTRVPKCPSNLRSACLASPVTAANNHWTTTTQFAQWPAGNEKIDRDQDRRAFRFNGRGLILNLAFSCCTANPCSIMRLLSSLHKARRCIMYRFMFPIIKGILC